MSAMVHSINASEGGVPKIPMREAWIGVNGVEGDRQADQRLHGGPDRAVCLYSLDLIEALQAEGHPIFPGSIGENVTVQELEWGEVSPGSRLRIGGAELEVTAFTSPCATIQASFLDSRYKRVSQKVNPGWSRVYARVLIPGHVTIGDPVSLL